MSSKDKFKHNLDLLQSEADNFAKNGSLIKKLFSISADHPVLSVMFAVSFGILVNALYDLVAYPLLDENPTLSGTGIHCLLPILFTLVCWLLVLRLRSLNPSLFVETPLNNKKLLVTLVSKGKEDYKDTPAYITYHSLLYSDKGHANINSLEKVVLVVTELPEVLDTAKKLKKHIEASGRTVAIFTISIDDRSLMEIQDQFRLLFKKYKAEYATNDTVADYTGGTKDMSVALLRESEKSLVTPIYLKSATYGEYSRASKTYAQ